MVNVLVLSSGIKCMGIFQAQEGTPGQEHGLTIDTQDSVADNSAAIEAVLVNTNQVITSFCLCCRKFQCCFHKT